MRAPIPPDLKGEAREIYQEELHKKIRVLLGIHALQRENLLMIERLGVNTDWAEKSKLAYAKLLKLLAPKIPGAPADLLAPAAAPEKPPVFRRPTSNTSASREVRMERDLWIPTWWGDSALGMILGNP